MLLPPSCGTSNVSPGPSLARHMGHFSAFCSPQMLSHSSLCAKSGSCLTGGSARLFHGNSAADQDWRSTSLRIGKTSSRPTEPHQQAGECSSLTAPDAIEQPLALCNRACQCEMSACCLVCCMLDHMNLCACLVCLSRAAGLPGEMQLYKAAQHDHSWL